jgi:hypothetical protein
MQSMARANSNHITLSSLILDPYVRAAFEAAERDGLAPLAVFVDKPPNSGIAPCEAGGTI